MNYKLVVIVCSIASCFGMEKSSNQPLHDAYFQHLWANICALSLWQEAKQEDQSRIVLDAITTILQNSPKSLLNLEEIYSKKEPFNTHSKQINLPYLAVEFGHFALLEACCAHFPCLKNNPENIYLIELCTKFSSEALYDLQHVVKPREEYLKYLEKTMKKVNARAQLLKLLAGDLCKQ